MLDARERLIVALDLPSIRDAEAMVARLGDAVCGRFACSADNSGNGGGPEERIEARLQRAELVM